MATIAEAALAEEGSHFDEAAIELALRELPEAELADAGGVGDVAVAHAVQGRDARGVAALGGVVAGGADLERELGIDGVEEAALADAARAREGADVAVDAIAERADSVARVGDAVGAGVEDGIAELGVGLEERALFVGLAVELVGESRVVAYDTFAIAVQALIAGDVDAVIMDDVAGAGYAGENAESVKIVGDPLVPTDELGFIYPKGSELVEAFNLAFAEMRIDGSLKAYNDFWILGITE